MPLDLNKAPNLKKYLEEHPEIDKQVKLDDGTYYTFPNIYGADNLLTYRGNIVRKDMLDKIGMAVPETIDEWHAVLTKAKNELGLKAPYTSNMDDLLMFASAYGVGPELYVEDGVVKFGPYEEGFKNLLTTLNKWYDEGLIDSNIANVDTKIIKQNILNGDTIAAFGNTGGGIGAWTTAFAQAGEKVDLQPAKYAAAAKGEKPFWGHRVSEYMSYGSACITTACKDLDAAYKLLDYGYSEEGRMLFSFGIEGESYEMIDGYPTYTELLTNNPDGKAFGDMLSIYTYPDAYDRYQKK